LLELAGAIECSTGRSALAYMMYGCYCGLGGQGWPRDRTDCGVLTIRWEGSTKEPAPALKQLWCDFNHKAATIHLRLSPACISRSGMKTLTATLILRCCHRHDCCYGDAELFGCHTKTDQYRWKCEEKTVKCDDLKDKCEKLLCRCDREAARCLRKAPFIQKYAVWPDFLCGHKQPTLHHSGENKCGQFVCGLEKDNSQCSMFTLAPCWAAHEPLDMPGQLDGRGRLSWPRAALAPPPRIQVMTGAFGDLRKDNVMGQEMNTHTSGGRVRKTTELTSRLGRYGSVGGDLCRAGFHMQPDADGAPPRVEYRDFPPPSPRCGLGVAAPIGRCVPSPPLLGNVCGGVVVVEGHPWVGSDARWGGVLLARRVGRCGGGRARTSAG
ncbi:unnamed protein product, partial [Tetraodon nigroviridis]